MPLGMSPPVCLPFDDRLAFFNRLGTREMQSVAPETIGRYRLLRKLGEGGMGVVFLAEDPTLGRRIALKVLKEARQADARARRRFVREARLAAALEHPFVCKVFEVGESEGRAYIAMEYVPGETLKDRLAGSRVPLHKALLVALRIADALAEAEEKGLVHRDLKPSNIMLTQQGYVKVMDFGLAKMVSGIEADDLTSQSSVLTEEGAVLGTPGYMSPEQLRGLRTDPRSDIFSFGVVLYEMVCGVHPFPGARRVDRMIAILKEEPVPMALHTVNYSRHRLSLKSLNILFIINIRPITGAGQYL